MATNGNIDVTLPPAVRRWAEGRVSAGDYPSVSDYLADLILADQRRRESLDGDLLAALDSGEPTEMTADDWNDVRNEVRRRSTARGGR